MQMLRGVGSKDHVHILVSVPLSISSSEIMRRIKGRTSRKYLRNFPIKKRYWGQHLGIRGYICVTAGELTKEMMEEFLTHHFERDPNDGFDVEK